MCRGLRRLLVVCASLGLLGAGCGKAGADKGPRARPPPLVSVTKVVERDVDVEAQAPVDLRPLSQADVGSKTLGYLDAVLVDRGDKVKKGQLLALVRPSDLPDQLAAARGVLAQLQASTALARTNYERNRQLAPSGVVSQQAFQQTAAALASAEAAEAATRAQISAIAVRLGETRIESPLDGVVSQRRLDPGALVGPPGGGAIVTVVRIDTLRMFVAVGERDAPRLSIGRDARVQLDALPGRTFGGKVVRLAPGFEPATRMLDAEVHVPNLDGELRPGMYGRGAIVLDTHPRAAVVPVAAVQISDRRRYAFVLAADRVQRRAIETGVDGGLWLEVKSGLRAGEEVVVAGADGLADGMAVRAVRDVDPYTGTRSASAPSAGEAPRDKAPN